MKVNKAILKSALHHCKKVTLDIDATEIVAHKADANLGRLWFFLARFRCSSSSFLNCLSSPVSRLIMPSATSVLPGLPAVPFLFGAPAALTASTYFLRQ